MNPPPPSNKSLLFCFIIVLSVSVPFLNKPYHIDDTFALHITRSILNNPLDPFAGEFDWIDHNQPVFEVTTNPPLVSYLLAPFAALSNESEIVLHAAMMIFPFLIAVSMRFFARRFTNAVWLPVLFVMTSCAVMVSGNVMRDVPAAGLATAGIACFISGTDRSDSRRLLLGSILAGLAILTKYSAVITLPILLLYPLLKRRYRTMFWVLPALVILAVWCLHNQIYYHAIHVVFLTLQRRSVTGITWEDKLCGALVIVGCISYLFPLALWKSVQHKETIRLGILAVALGVAWWFIQRHFHDKADGEYLFWSCGGVILLVTVFGEGLKRGWRFLKDPQNPEAVDSLFLIAWLAAPVLFSILLVPFQAVRHLILALPPLTLLAFRHLQRTDSGRYRPALLTLLVIQAFIAFFVHAADYEFAATYRDFCAEAKTHWSNSPTKLWYLGHWGWQYYADQAGFHQVHKGEELPQEGDILFRPDVSPVDNVFEDHPDLPKRFILLEEKKYPGKIPIRVMNWNGASFYACIGAWGTPNMPYRFFSPLSLETIRTFRVGPPAAAPSPPLVPGASSSE